jgi:hypothetical protein
MVNFNKFELRVPSAQNLIDIFSGKWASDFSRVYPGLNAGTAEVFVTDTRVPLAAQFLGRNARLDGMEILELGPLEAGHSYALEQLGANVTAVEANCEAYLKCLIVKELLALKKTKFLLGDFCLFLAEADRTFDMVFASGVLYHMPDPLQLIELIASRTNRCFVWSHFFDPNHYPGAQRTARTVQFGTHEFTYHELAYPDMGSGSFWGGNKPVASWLSREDMLSAFKIAGFDQVKVIQEHLTHPHGACMSFIAQRN